MTKVKLLHAVCTLALLSAVPSLAQTSSQTGGMNGGSAAENAPAKAPATENMKEHEPSAENTEEHEPATEQEPSTENMKEHEPATENMKEHENDQQMKENGAEEEKDGSQSRVEPRRLHKITRTHAVRQQSDTSQNEAVDRLNQQSLDAARSGQPFTGSAEPAAPPTGSASGGSMK